MTTELTEPRIAAATITQLAHDIRQPLSGIENVAYFLEMILPQADDRVAAQFERLRRFIDQANWILEDAVGAAQELHPRLTPYDLGAFLTEFASQIALHSDRALQLRIADERLEARIDPALTKRTLEWLLEFARSVAVIDGPISLSAQRERGATHVVLEMTPQVREAGALVAMLDPKTRTGFLRAIVEAQNASLDVTASVHGRLSITLSYS